MVVIIVLIRNLNSSRIGNLYLYSSVFYNLFPNKCTNGISLLIITWIDVILQRAYRNLSTKANRKLKDI